MDIQLIPIPYSTASFKEPETPVPHVTLDSSVDGNSMGHIPVATQVQSDWAESSSYIDLSHYSLHEAIEKISIDSQVDIPFIIWLLENPNSPISLPGKVDLYGHDCIHVLLDRPGHSLADEAFVVGFSMGNDPHTNWLHLFLFKLISSSVYPRKYRFLWKNFQEFDAGFAYGRSVQSKNLTRVDFRLYQNCKVSQIRQQFGLLIPYQLKSYSSDAPVLTVEKLVECRTSPIPLLASTND